MPRIVTCVEHKRYYEDLDFTPIGPQEEGHVLATAVSADGVVHLDCYFCTWASGAEVEQALGSVGYPTLTTPPQPIVNQAPRIVNIPKKEKNVAKTEAPKKRDRTPKKSIVSRKFGPNIEVAVYLKGGTIEDVLALPEAERTALFDLLTGIKAETPKGA